MCMLKNKVKNLFYILLAGMLSLLGFSSCKSSKSVTIDGDRNGKFIPRDDPGRMRLMYGVPPREFIEGEDIREEVKEEVKE